MKIVLNIGHGGDTDTYDSGAMSLDLKTSEHFFNKYELGPLVIKELQSKGHEIVEIIQHKNFGELISRINSIPNVDLILSLHSNAYNNHATGTEVLYFALSKKSKQLAECLQKRIVNVLGLADRGAKGLFVGRGSALLIKTKSPCVILEPFFIDNPGDLSIVRKKLPELAKAISYAVDDWKNL